MMLMMTIGHVQTLPVTESHHHRTRVCILEGPDERNKLVVICFMVLDASAAACEMDTMIFHEEKLSSSAAVSSQWKSLYIGEYKKYFLKRPFLLKKRRRVPS